MKKLVKRFILACSILCIVGASVVFFLTYVNRSAIFSEIKDATEKKMSALLNARVRISDINLGFLSGISLKNLTVDEEDQDTVFSFLDVKRIVLRLNPFGLIFRRPELQNAIIMDTPQFRIRVPDGAQAVFSWDPFFSWGEVSVLVKNGSAQYAIPKTDYVVGFSGIHGRVDAAPDNKYHIDFEGNVSEALTGAWHIAGVVDQPNREVDVSLQFSDVSLAEEMWGPFSDISGRVHLTTTRIQFDELSVRIRNMRFVLNGIIDNYLTHPVFDLAITVENYHLADVVRLTGDAVEKTFSLFFDCFKRDLSINGRFDMLQEGLRIYDAYTSTGYAVDGSFSVRDDAYTMHIANETKAVDIDFSAIQGKPTVRVHLDHVMLFGFDVVLDGYCDVLIDRAVIPTDSDRITCSMKTDLFIFNYLPLEDFNGSFSLGKEGFTDISFSWGEVYRLSGVMAGAETFPLDLTLTIDEYAIDEIEQFMSKPLSIEVGGNMSGVVDISGIARDPRFTGDMRIASGKFGSFSYDEAIMKFDGDVKALYFRDSHIVKKGRKFYVKGNIDFTQRNILNDVVIQTSERIIIWQGWDIGQSRDGDELVVEKKLTDNLTLDAKTAPAESRGDQYVEGSVGLEYAIDKSKAVRVQAHEGEKGETLDIRHTITF